MGMKKADYLTGLALIVLSLYVLIESWRMPRLEHLQVHPLSVPGVVPAFLAAVLLVFGAILVGRSVIAGGHHLGWTRESMKKAMADPGFQRLQLTAVLTIAYAGILVGRIPYWLATAVFIFAFILVFEWRSGMPPKQKRRIGIVAAILAVIVTGAVSYVFERLFLVTLP
jgi:putative tricarboxylic transport membrane protein